MLRGSRLRWRLLSSLGLATAFALLLLGLFVRGVVRWEVESNEALDPAAFERTQQALDRAAAQLVEHQRDHGWDGLGGLLDGLAQDLDRYQELVVFDATGRLVGASFDGLLDGRTLPDGGPSSLGDEFELTLRAPRGQAAVAQLVLPFVDLMTPTGQPLGRLQLTPTYAILVGETSDDPRQQLVAAFDRWLLPALVVALCGSIVTSWWLGRRLLRPLEALTAGVERITHGDLDGAVPIEGDDEVATLGSAFNRMTASLRRTEALRRQLVNDVAHELRTPLTRLRAQLEALADGLAPPSPERLHALVDETVLLADLVHDLEELARAEAGQLRLEIHAVDVRQVADTAVQALASTPGAKLSTDLPGDLPDALCDPRRLRQMLDNLLTNARTHTPPEGAIRVTGRADEATVELSVVDNGPGLDPEAQAQVFERFYRADPSRDRATGGTGLGLAIVAQWAQAQGGRAWVESTPGQGACFTIALPRA